MLKTKTFISYGTLNSIREYQEFIANNQHIEIISVNILTNDDVLLTYKE
ncbi:hypothetical protein [Solibacillus isronensis]